MRRRPVMVGFAILLVLVTLAIIIFVSEARNSQQNLAATSTLRQMIDATNHAVMTAIGPPDTKRPPTSTLSPDVLASVTARNATNAANATQSWIHVQQTATSRAQKH